MKKLVFAAVSTALICALAFSQGCPKAKKALPFSKGINLPGWMEYSRLNTGLYGKGDFENIKSLGVEVIRLPVWFEAWNEGEPGFKVADECFETLDKALSWCEELGIFLIVDFHNNCDGSSKTDPKIERVLLKVWPQIAERYKERSEKILYEIMNEPHFKSGNIKADCAKWAKIQGNVIKAIRAVDQKHWIVAGGGDWNSIDSMLALPDYGDDKLVYNFHDYSPFLFTHQGAAWTDAKRLVNIPFPYSKEKMPPLPKNASETERALYKNYPAASDEKALKAPLDKAVEFADKRNAALMCNEFGVYMPYADVEERANWYRLKLSWMDERGICRISWDYTQEFGLFKSPWEGMFPQDLNAPVVRAMGYKIPSGEEKSWFKAAQKSGDWTIYKNGSAPCVKTSVASSSAKGSLLKKDSDGHCIEIYGLSPYNSLLFDFNEPCDLTALKEGGARLEFEVKSSDKNARLNVYFRDVESRIFPWRAQISVFPDNAKADGLWHKVSKPLKDFLDVGGWTEATEWKNGEGKFSWAYVGALVVENGGNPSKAGFSVKNIRIAK